MDKNPQSPQPPHAPARRRRWLWGLGGAGALASLLACAGIARAHCHHGHCGGRIDPETAIQRIEAVSSIALWRIDATPEEKAKINAITRDAVHDLLPLREAHRAARQQAVALLGAKTIDRAALEQLRQTQIQQADSASKRLTQALADAAEALDPARRARLAERISAHMGS